MFSREGFGAWDDPHGKLAGHHVSGASMAGMCRGSSLQGILTNESATLQVAPGDTVVLGSDGLWDNLADDALVEAVAAGRSAREGAPALARRLAGEAFRKSLDSKSESPYSLGASEAFDMVYSGGKRDDITVLVALVQ